MKRLVVLSVTALAGMSLIATGCGSSSSSSSAAPKAKEVSPAGDIPDNQAYVAYAPPGAGFSVKVPEGWSRSSARGATTFTDKLNSVRMEAVKAASSPTVASVKSRTVPQLAGSVATFKAGRATAVKRTAGAAVRLTYQATSAPDPVTGKTHRDAVERYEFFKRGRVAVLTLTGPVGADNVDPWKIVTDSLRWTR